MRFSPCLTASFLLFGSPIPTKAASPDPAATVTKPPQLLVSPEPIYPEDAIRDGVEGDIVLQLDIDANGHVSAVQVVTPAGHGFDEAAVEAAKQFVFSPAELDGKPIAVRVNYTHH